MCVTEDFIEPLLRVFDRPPGGDADAFFADLAEDLSTFSPNVLRTAVKDIRRSRRFHTFPTIGECFTACNQATRDAAAGSGGPAVALPWETKPADKRHQEQARRRACYLCRCVLGEEADRGGWLPALIDFVVDHDRLPHGRDIEVLRATADKHADAIQRVFDEGKGAANPLGPALAKFRAAMLRKAHADVFGGAVR